MVKHTFLSLSLETFVYLVIYRVTVFGYLRKYLTKEYKKMPFWNTLAKHEKEGKTNEAVQREIVYWSLLTVHHCTGGIIMTLGYLLNLPEIFLRGCLIEMVDDVHDTIILIFREWPFFKDESNAELMFFMIPHHTAGLLSIFPIILQGYYKNVNVMALASALLMAGGLTLGVGALQRMLDRTNPVDIWNEVVITSFNLFFFFICRFWIFPTRLYAFLVTDGVFGTMPPAVKLAVTFGASLMMFFNFAAGAISIQKLMRRVNVAKEVSPTLAIENNLKVWKEYSKKTMDYIEKEVYPNAEEFISSLTAKS